METRESRASQGASFSAHSLRAASVILQVKVTLAGAGVVESGKQSQHGCEQRTHRRSECGEPVSTTLPVIIFNGGEYA